MPFFDLSLEELRTYKPARSEPADFDAYWGVTLEDARKHPLDARFTPADFGLKIVETYDVTYAGYAGQPVKGWFILPAGTQEKLPCVVEFIGYGGGRGFPIQWLTWPAAGYALLVMDTRGQGSNWLHGDTPDQAAVYPPHTPGFMSLGIQDRHHYYYRRVYTDAVRAVETVRTHDRVDPARVAVTGGSQGGGISIAVAGLVADLPVCMPDVPFLCQFRAAVGKTEAHPYAEIVRYLSIHRDQVENVFQTLDYFDGVNFAARIRARSLFSTALMDPICPPSTVFAAYNQVTAEKDIKVYPYNEHEGGASHHAVEKIRFLNALWRA